MAELTSISEIDTEDEGATAANFAASEIAAPEASTTSSEAIDPASFAKQAVLDLDLIQYLNDLQMKPGVFEIDPDRLSTALNDAYPIYLYLIAGGKAAWSEAKRHAHFKGRTRAPKRGTEAMVALSIIAKPTPEESGRCSSQATKLVYAAAKNIPRDRFAELMRGVTLEDARITAAEIRKQLKGRASKEVTSHGRHRVELIWTDESGHRQRCVGSISKKQHATLAGAGGTALRNLRLQLIPDAETSCSSGTGVE